MQEGLIAICWRLTLSECRLSGTELSGLPKVFAASCEKKADETLTKEEAESKMSVVSQLKEST